MQAAIRLGRRVLYSLVTNDQPFSSQVYASPGGCLLVELYPPVLNLVQIINQAMQPALSPRPRRLRDAATRIRCFRTVRGIDPLDVLKELGKGWPDVFKSSARI